MNSAYLRLITLALNQILICGTITDVHTVVLNGLFTVDKFKPKEHVTVHS